ncbi:MAG: hypothetical protein K5637_02975 [Lachnospiraceae bacterium]|nr:hypothetical protein [Lachnospiraceae bacterium]
MSIPQYKMHGIETRFTPGAAHITINQPLRDYLKRGRGARLQLAYLIRKAYAREYGNPLRISVRSLGTEIVWHVRVLDICRFFKGGFFYRMLPPFRKLVDWFILHMEQIDCGEKREDNNRFVWDLLSDIKNIKKRLL